MCKMFRSIWIRNRIIKYFNIYGERQNVGGPLNGYWYIRRPIIEWKTNDN